MLINVAEWRRQRISERAMDYIAKEKPQYFDQWLLNVVLSGKSLSLDPRFNCLSDVPPRNWRAIREIEDDGRLIHFIDSPGAVDYWENEFHILSIISGDLF